MNMLIDLPNTNKSNAERAWKMGMIKYSIITICKNCACDLEITLNSIRKQAFGKMNNVEIVIIDGNSTDKTAEVVHNFKKETKDICLTFISENDKGIYDAMNKGVKNAKGIWCIFLNAGDCFFDSFALRILDESAKMQYDIVYGDAVHKYGNKCKIVLARDESKLTFNHGMEFCHQSSAIKREYALNNPYSLNYRIAGDCDFFTKAFKNGAKFKHADGIVSVFSKDGISSRLGYLVEKENAMVLHNYNMIDDQEYKVRINKAKRIEMIRKALPDFLIDLRQKAIMRQAVKTWKDFESI